MHNECKIFTSLFTQLNNRSETAASTPCVSVSFHLWGQFPSVMVTSSQLSSNNCAPEWNWRKASKTIIKLRWDFSSVWKAAVSLCLPCLPPKPLPPTTYAQVGILSLWPQSCFIRRWPIGREPCTLPPHTDQTPESFLYFFLLLWMESVSVGKSLLKLSYDVKPHSFPFFNLPFLFTHSHQERKKM